MIALMASESVNLKKIALRYRGTHKSTILTCNTLPEGGGKKKDPISSTSLVANAFKHMFNFDVISGNALNFR